MADQLPYTKPLPAISRANQAFWKATLNGQLVLPHCRRCGNTWFPASTRCPQCLSTDVDSTQASGRGRLWSWVIMHRRYIKEFDPPYVVGFVELEEGPMLMSTIVGARPEQLACEMLLEIIFESATPEMSIAKFRLAGGAFAPVSSKCAAG
jgi:uncharacterized protein